MTADALTPKLLNALAAIKCKTFAEQGQQAADTNLFIALNTTTNQFRNVVSKHDVPSTIVPYPTARLIAAEKLVPNRELAQANYITAKFASDELSAVISAYGGEDDTPIRGSNSNVITLPVFKRILQEMDAMLNKETDLGRYYKEVLAQTLSVVDQQMQAGKLWTENNPPGTRPTRERSATD